MILQTIVLLIGVVGASYVLACASWQIVLSSFMCAGFGYALWQTRRALVRRAKIKELWQRSLDFDHLLDELDDDEAYDYFVNQAPKKNKEQKSASKECEEEFKVSRFPIQKISSV